MKTKFNKNEYLGCSSKDFDLDYLRKHCLDYSTVKPLTNRKEAAELLLEAKKECEENIAMAERNFEGEKLQIKIRTYKKVCELKTEYYNK